MNATLDNLRYILGNLEVISMQKTVALILPFIFSCAAFADTNLKPKIGVILPLTGPLSSLGEKVKRGVLLAAESEGLPAQSLIFEDGEFSNSAALTAAQKLMSVDRIDGLVGPFGPGQTAAVSGVTRPKKIPVIAVSLCDKNFPSNKGAWCSYMSPDDQAIPVLRRFREAEFHESSKRIASLIEEVDGFNDYRELLIQFSKENDRKLLFDERFPGGTKDFRTLLLKMKNADVSLLTVAAVDPKIAQLILRQAHDINFKPKVRWLVTERDDHVFAQHPELFDDIWYLSLATISEKFERLLADRFKAEADIYPAIGYDATRSLIRALNAKRIAPDKEIGEILLSLPIDDTAFVGFHFDKDSGVAMESKVARFEKGKVRFLEP